MNRLKNLYILVIAILISTNTIAQSDSSLTPSNKTTSITAGDSINKAKPQIFVGMMPVFTEGDYRTFIAKNIIYPKEAEKAGIQGKVYVKFVIEKDGAITNIKVVKGLSPSQDDEAIRVVKLTNGKWTPGYNNGKPTRVYYNLEIDFVLRK